MFRKHSLSQEPVENEADDEYKDLELRQQTKCTLFFAYTSNLISSGLRETIRYLVEHTHVHVITTTAGGVEEDLIKCLAPTFIGDFNMKGADLRLKGLPCSISPAVMCKKLGMNRIGNLLVPNSNYCKFEDWITPILDKMIEEQKKVCYESTYTFRKVTGYNMDTV